MLKTNSDLSKQSSKPLDSSSLASPGFDKAYQAVSALAADFRAGYCQHRTQRGILCSSCYRDMFGTHALVRVDTGGNSATACTREREKGISVAQPGRVSRIRHRRSHRRVSFGAAVHLILTGELPAPPVARFRAFDGYGVGGVDRSWRHASKRSTRFVDRERS